MDEVVGALKRHPGAIWGHVKNTFILIVPPSHSRYTDLEQFPREIAYSRDHSLAPAPLQGSNCSSQEAPRHPLQIQILLRLRLGTTHNASRSRPRHCQDPADRSTSRTAQGQRTASPLPWEYRKEERWMFSLYLLGATWSLLPSSARPADHAGPRTKPQQAQCHFP